MKEQIYELFQQRQNQEVSEYGLELEEDTSDDEEEQSQQKKNECQPWRG